MAEAAEPSVRERIVNAAAELLQARGYAAASMRDIVEAARAPRGSLQHYFPGGKTQLALEAIALGRDRVSAAIDASFAKAGSADGGARWFFDRSAELLVESDFALGCPLATVALEQAGLENEIADACRAAFDAWVTHFAAAFTSHGIPAGEAQRLGTLALSQYEGAILLARVKRDPEPLRTAGALVADLVRAAG